jgi:hypothetical protein
LAIFDRVCKNEILSGDRASVFSCSYEYLLPGFIT